MKGSTLKHRWNPFGLRDLCQRPKSPQPRIRHWKEEKSCAWWCKIRFLWSSAWSIQNGHAITRIWTLTKTTCGCILGNLQCEPHVCTFLYHVHLRKGKEIWEWGCHKKKIPTSHKRSIATCWLYEGEFWRSSRSHIKRGCHINNEGDFFERGRRREYLFFFSEEIFLREVDGENIYFSLARRFFLRRHTKKRYFF